jgi:hypothetical protein
MTGNGWGPLPDFNVMTHDAASALLGILTVLAFAVAVEYGRNLDHADKPNKIFLISTLTFYLLVYAVVGLLLLAVLNGQGQAIWTWYAAGFLFVVDGFVFLTLVATRD